jgi:hypothetical protein
MIKQIPGHTFYAVSDTGEVYSLVSGVLMELKKDISNGYPRVKIGGKKRYVADLVAETFLGPPERDDYKVFYIDGDKENCDVRNLIWLSQSDIKMNSQYSVEYRSRTLRGRA